MLSSGTPGVCKSFFRNCRYRLQTRLTVLSTLMYNISKKFSNYLQIKGYSLPFIPTIIDITIFRQVDNKRFNFNTKYITYDAKLFLFFNPNFQRIYFLYVLIGLSPQLLMGYLYRHSSDERDILIDSMPFLWDSICSDTEATVEQNSHLFTP